ncbi:GNAT family N-acetyltransferase [Deinococcus depolymerans]|uniref:GNAT family N-acetyltransferase n=1 Tax=Deinococcus depolymerans TaxID=392408 RepID=A0ABP3LV59_9DEIO
MSTAFTLQAATPDTLTDIHALHPDPAEAARRLSVTQERVRAGQLDPARFLLLRAGGAVQGVCFIGPNARVPLFPTYRTDTPADALTAFLRELRRRVSDTPDRQLLLDDTLVTPRPEEAVQAGWVPDSQQVLYRTDLRARSHAPDPDVTPVHPDDPGVAEALRELGRPDWEAAGGWTLHALRREGQVLALGATGPGGRPGEAGLDLIGVRPAQRGRGYGARLHAHLLGVAAQTFASHTGGTDAGNHAMRRTFERSGSVLSATQAYYRQA